MKYADFMAFPFSQHELMEKQEKLKISQDIVLDFCQITSVPAYVKNIDDIVQAHVWFLNLLAKQDVKTRPVCFFGVQHPPEEAKVSDLLFLKGMGVRFMTLAYYDTNEYGGGFATPDEPLTEKGRKLIEMMAEAGIVLDLSHAGHRTAREAIDYISRSQLRLRVVATHTACFSIYNHGRGLPDDVLCGIRDLGGLVGLVTLTWILHETDNSIKPFLDHLVYLVDLIGDGSVCLGTDSVYRYLDSEEEEKRFEIMKAKLDPHGIFRARHPEQAVELNKASKLLVIEKELSSLGWVPKRIQNIMGENLIRFFLSAL